jgi:hypothetical protein
MDEKKRERNRKLPKDSSIFRFTQEREKVINLKVWYKIV